MENRTLAAALLLLCVAASAAAQTATPAQTTPPAPRPTPASPPPPKPTPTPSEAQAAAAASEAQKKYDALLEKAKKGEGTVDYKALRFAYFETPGSSPLGMLDYRDLWTHVGQQNWAKAAKQAEAVLEKNYVDANAHMVAFIAYREQGNDEQARLHRRWADGLLDSIKADGDGKSADTAWHVISVSEEYAVLRSMSLRVMGQSLVNEKEHFYDVIQTLDPKNAEATFYFNIDKPFSAYGRK